MAQRPVLVVMAAGMGSRYGGLKQIDPVGPGGAAILDYSLYDARRAGFETVVIIIKREIEADFKATVGARLAGSGLDIRYAYQQLEMLPPGFSVPAGRQKPWGTAHAVLCAAGAIGQAPFAVINADDYYGPTGFQLVYGHLAGGMDAAGQPWAMVGFLLGNTVSENGAVSRGVCALDGAGRLRTVTERTRIETCAGGTGIHYTEDGGKSWQDLPADTVVSMNLWGFGADFLPRARAGFADFLRRGLAADPLKCEYYLPSVVSAALADGSAAVKVLTSPDKWYGITYREDKPGLVAALRAMHGNGLYPADKLF